MTGTSVTTDSSGNKLATVKYFPFGTARLMTGNLNTDKLFTGQRLDDTGLYYYNARYYDATIGRFISPDSIVPDPFNPQSLNRYSYCLNNPLRYVDPSGYAYADNGILSPGEMFQLYAEIMYYDSTGGESGGGDYPEDWDVEDAVDYLGIDSDWGDMLGRMDWGNSAFIWMHGPNMATKFAYLEFGEGRAKIYDSLARVKPDMTLLWLMYGTTLLSDVKGYSCTLDFGSTRFKLDDGNKWWNRNGNYVIVGGVAAVATAVTFGIGLPLIAYGCGLAAGATTLVGAIEGLEVMAYGGVIAGGGFITDVAIITHAFKDTNSSASAEVAHEVFESFTVSLEP